MLTFAMAHPYLATWIVLTIIWIPGAAIKDLMTFRNNALKVRLAELAEREQERKAGQ